MSLELPQKVFVVDVEHAHTRVFTAGTEQTAVLPKLAAECRLGKLPQSFGHLVVDACVNLHLKHEIETECKIQYYIIVFRVLPYRFFLSISVFRIGQSSILCSVGIGLSLSLTRGHCPLAWKPGNNTTMVD